MIIDLFLLLYTILLGLVTAWAAYSSYLVFRCGVPPVPTHKNISKTMIKAAQLTQNQKVYDLGCGFGDVLLTAHKQSPQNIYQGFDINAPVLWVARWRARRRKIVFTHQDFFTSDLTDAEVIFCYLWPSIMDRLATEIWPHLKPGTRVISHAFPLADITPVETRTIKKSKVWVYVK